MKLFNICNEEHQNPLSYHREIKLKNVKVNISLANQSNHNYVGNSNVFYTQYICVVYANQILQAKFK